MISYLPYGFLLQGFWYFPHRHLKKHRTRFPYLPGGLLRTCELISLFRKADKQRDSGITLK